MKKKVNYEKLFTKRKDGRFQAHYYDREHKRHTLIDRDAQRLYERMQGLSADKPYTFAEAIDEWYTDHCRNIRESTKAVYDSSVRNIRDAFGDRAVTDITANEIYIYLQKLADKDFATSTVTRYKSIFKLVFRRACLAGHITQNPALDIPSPKCKDKQIREPPSDELIKKVMSSADDQMGLFALFLLCTGCRRNEASAVRWEDIDFKKGTVTINKQISYVYGITKVTEPKTKSGTRVVPLLKPLREKLEPIKGKGYLFHQGDPDEPLRVGYFHWRWEKYQKRIGTSLTPHCFRHGFATLLYEAGVDAFAAAKLLGHSNVQTTLQIYTHLRERNEKQSLEKLEEYMSCNYIR